MKRSTLRRFVLSFLVGLILMALGSGITWLILSHPSPTSATPTAPARVITEFPAPTSKSTPNVITAGPDGNLWFEEFNGNQIGHISSNGKIIEFPIPTASGGLNWITTGPDGNLWFTENQGDKIGRFTSGGK